MTSVKNLVGMLHNSCSAQILILPIPVTAEPPFPIYLFGLVSSLKEKSAKGYPVKKVPDHQF